MDQDQQSAELDEKICRICMKDAEDLYSIFDTGKIGEEKHKIMDILTESTSIEVNLFPGDTVFIIFSHCDFFRFSIYN